ncbi:MAG: DUF2726 domain-containing protein [Lentisphaerae bacterium]|nr:DUF2726 domain-containing protein [Lentisphaerota bacterium]
MPNLIGQFLPVIGVLVLLAIIVGVIRALTAGRTPATGFPYEREAGLFSPAERSFLGVLEQAVAGQFRIFGKVRLADVIGVKRGLSRSTQQSAFNRIQSKHLDFVVCDPDTLSVEFAVELDDSSHGRAARKQRDTFVDEALAAAGVPLFRFSAKRSYSVQSLRDQLFDVSTGT